jgi:hypothetical protein
MTPPAPGPPAVGQAGAIMDTAGMAPIGARGPWSPGTLECEWR